MTRDTINLSKAAALAGWQVERLASWRVPDWLVEQKVLLYEEPLFVAVASESLGLAMIEPPFNWLPELPIRHHSRDVRLTTVSEARQLAESAFVKPADDKSFHAKVYGSGRELPSREIAPDSAPVLISDPVIWEIEIRAFVLHRAVRTSSAYKRHGEVLLDDWTASDSELSGASEFLRTLLADQNVRVPPSVVIDVGRIAQKGWAVVEANASWGSGLYGCDPDLVLPVVHRACVPKINMTDADREWLIERTTPS